MIPPIKGKVTSKFGYRVHPVTKIKGSFHNGVDIAAPVGTIVVAPEDGRITEVWDNATGGKCIAMCSMDGKRYGFAHLNRQIAKLNQFVVAGEVIAESGNTGASTGPHVHFTVKINGSWVNPENYFKF